MILYMCLNWMRTRAKAAQCSAAFARNEFIRLLHTKIIPVRLKFLQHAFFGQLAAEIPLDTAG